MLLWTKQVLFTKHVILLLQFIFNQGINVSFGECWRTPQMAQWNYEHHLGIVHSLHIKRLAVDLIFHDIDGTWIKDPKKYEAAGKYWESLHPDNRAGVFFKHGIGCDPGHFEMMDIIPKNLNGRSS